MSPVLIFVVLVLVVGVFGGMAVLAVTGNSSSRLSKRERAELKSLRELSDTLLDHAIEHREMDSTLSVIVIDEIRQQRRAIE